MKKVLSFVLVLSLVLSSFSMAFAGETKTAGLSDVAGNANEEAIQVAYNLGIVTGNPDGTFLPAKSVNRAEFAAMITRALGIPESALAGYTATSFKDTVGYDWAVPYLAFCDSKGIMLGDGNGNAMPGQTITVNEAMTMALRAVGYTNNSAELVGTWPANYVTKAQDLGLYSEVAAVNTVDKANAAQIIYNTLTVQKVAVDADGFTQGIADVKIGGVFKEASMLTTGLNCDYSVGVVDIVAPALINLVPYVGAYGEIFVNGDDEVVAFKPYSTYVTGTFTVDGTQTVFVTNDDVTYKLPASVAGGTIATTTTAITNGQSATAVVGNAYTVDTQVYTLGVEISGKTIKAIHSIATWATDNDEQALATVQEDITEDLALAGLSFAQTDEDEIDFDSFQLVGVNSLSEIKKDHIVYVYAYGTGANNIVKVAVGTEVVEGLVTDYDVVDGTPTWTVNGKDYVVATSKNNVSLDGLNATSVGNTYKLFLDAYGDIHTAVLVQAVPDTYGVITNFQPAGIEDAKVKMFTSEGTTKTFTVDEDAVTELGNLFSTATAINGMEVLVGYHLDKNGVIETVDYSVLTAGVGSTVGAKLFNVSGGSSYDYLADTVVFTSNPGVGYDLAKMTDLEATLTVASKYIKNGDNEIVAILVGAVDANATADDTYAVFHNVSSRYDENLDTYVDRIVGFEDGVALDKKADRDSLPNATVVTGAAYKVDYDSEGYITALTQITDGGNSGKWAVKGTLTATTVAGLTQDKTAVRTAGTDAGAYELADAVVVYYYNQTTGEYELSKVSALRENYYITLVNVDADDTIDFDIVIWTK